MLIRPGRDDIRLIGFYLGRIVLGIALIELLPLGVALWRGEWNEATALVVGIAIAVGIGATTSWRLHSRKDLAWSHAMVTVAMGWLVGAVIAAIPIYLSGHFGSFFDACFDMMSGFTATGLTILQDLDHLSLSMQAHRHLTHFAGGQGIIIVVLTMLATSSGNVATMYASEARDDRIVPSIVRTSRFIFQVASVFLVVGTGVLWVIGMLDGLAPGRALFHGFNIFIAAFDTGGFAPYTTSMGFYHSVTYEVVVMVFMVAGGLSFALHYELWRGRRNELVRNFEVRGLAFMFTATALIILVGLAQAGAYTEAEALFRKGIFTVISVVTSAGFGVNNGALFTSDWGLIAPAGMVFAMTIGAMGSSTSGGIKVIRVALAAKSVARDLRRAIQPDAAVVMSSYHMRRRQVITDAQVRSAVTIIVLFLLSYLGGAVVGVLYGYPFDAALFESTSATANGGLSVGIVAPDLAMPLKVMYFLQMWAGRLEFMAVFALIGFVIAAVRGRS